MRTAVVALLNRVIVAAPSHVAAKVPISKMSPVFRMDVSGQQRVEQSAYAREHFDGASDIQKNGVHRQPIAGRTITPATLDSLKLTTCGSYVVEPVRSGVRLAVDQSSVGIVYVRRKADAHRSGVHHRHSAKPKCHTQRNTSSTHRRRPS